MALPDKTHVLSPKYIVHENLWWWGKSFTIILDNGKGMIELGIKDDLPDAGCVQSLLVHETVRQRGIGNALLSFAEEKARELGLEQIYLCARKGTFLIPWYRSRGFEIYDENPEYSKGQTVAMNKYL